jgi:hypothetical protein
VLATSAAHPGFTEKHSTGQPERLLESAQPPICIMQIGGLALFQPPIVGATESEATKQVYAATERDVTVRVDEELKVRSDGATEASSSVGQYERQDGYKESVVYMLLDRKLSILIYIFQQRRCWPLAVWHLRPRQIPLIERPLPAPVGHYTGSQLFRSDVGAGVANVIAAI